MPISYNFEKQKELFHLANAIFENYNITKEQWSFGGGTALSLLFYNHRMSFDIDIFIDDSNAFDKLFAKKEEIRKDLKLKKESVFFSTNSLTFILETEKAGVKLDFLGFKNLSNYPNISKCVFEIENIQVQSVEEILTKKIKIREKVTVRDYVDFAFAEEDSGIIGKFKKEEFLTQDRFIDIFQQFDNFDEEEFETELKYMDLKDIKSKRDIEKKLFEVFYLKDIIKVGCDSKDVVLFDEFIEKERSFYEEIEKIDIFSISKTLLEKKLKIADLKFYNLIGIDRDIIQELSI